MTPLFSKISIICCLFFFCTAISELPAQSCTGENDSPCNDGNACTVNDVCINGICVGTPINCNDNNPCTDDTCFPATGCQYTNDDLNVCSDGSICTNGDHCISGNCVGIAIVCPPDNDPCTIEACHPLTGCYQIPASGASCDDGNPCTENDICINGICAGTPKNCDDGNLCTTDFCEISTGLCMHINNNNSCDDGNPCTQNDVCIGGVCTSGSPTICTDNNPCTDDVCVPFVGCVFTNDNTNSCSDNSICTNSDHCVNGACVGTPITCPEDNNPCTVAACNPITGCIQSPANGVSCDDGNPCTINDVCINGICQGTPKNCSDGNICTNDFCDITTGDCYHINNTASCSDGNPCTQNDVCIDGVCTAGTPTACNDNNPCTDDTCVPFAGCVFTNDNTNTCSDNSICTNSDHCFNGSCVGTPITCPEDSNPCTVAACNPITGCIQSPANGAPCDDGNPCTINDFCINGNCQGTPKNCSDGNICTTDFCDITTGNCYFVNNTAVCNDGNDCTVGDYCSAGVCNPGSPVVCNDNNECTNDFCNPVSGCVHIPFAAVKFVTSSGNSGIGTLRNIILNSCIGDTIQFNVNLVNLTSPISIPHFLYILGNGQETTIINCGLVTKALIINTSKSLLVEKVKFINGYDTVNGGSILNAGTLHLRNVSFENNFEGSNPKALTSIGTINVLMPGTSFIFK